MVPLGLKEEAAIWWKSLGIIGLAKFSDEEMEKLLMDKWSRARKKDKGKHVGLFPTGISLLQVHGLIKKEKIVVFINPSCKHNFINVNLAKNCKSQQNILKIHKVMIRMFKFIRI